MGKWLLRLAVIFGLWFFVHTIYVVIDGLSDDLSTADIAVVLGNKVNEDGSLSERLQKRVDASFDLYAAHRVKKILVS